MGLAKCWRIVTGHGGHIEVADAQPGAAFTIALPAGEDEAPAVGA
jgi:K+-sensing histidine kinase KdpD